MAARRFPARLAGRQPGLKLIAQTGQFLQIRGMRKRPAQARFVVGELTLRDVQVTLGFSFFSSYPATVRSTAFSTARVRSSDARDRRTVWPRPRRKPAGRCADTSPH